jgi:septal ring-binding cell division protein DamX
MGRLSAPLLVLATAVLAAVALSACGDSGAELLPGKTAKEIEANLDEVARLAGEGECVGAEDAAQQVSAEIDALGNVDSKLKQALGEGAARLNEVVARCEEAEPPEEEELEPAEAQEEVESTEKSKQGKGAEKPEKKEPEEEAEEPAEEETAPPSKGKGKGAENGQGPEGTGPPGLSEPPSGGVGPGTEVEGAQ